MCLVPDKTDSIPVSPLTEGYDTQRLSVNFHEFSGTNSTRKIAYVFSHANGFHKECFHPIMKRLVEYLRSEREYDQTDITFVSWDARNHGDSARLNEGTLSKSFTWISHALDTKQVIDYYDLKTNYDRVIGVGHSFGASSMLLLEFHYPKTFDGLCIMEPVLFSFLMPMEKFKNHPFVVNTIKRRDEWSNREECSKSLLSRSFFRAFHPETFELHVKYGMYDTDKGTVKLKCPKEEETWIFYTTLYPTFFAYRTIPYLTIPAHFVTGSTSNVSLVDYDELTELNKENWVTRTELDGSHMVPNEKPDLIIPEIKYLMSRMEESKETTHAKL